MSALNVASRELCEKLHDLSGWSDTNFCWNGQLIPAWWPPEMRDHDINSFPAYDLAYILDHIQAGAELSKISVIHLLQAYIDDDLSWADAACALAISLFKEGSLVNERNDKQAG